MKIYFCSYHEIMTHQHLAGDGWNDWGNWSSCTQSCGGGIMTRNRKCRTSRKDHLNCPGLEVEEAACNNRTCPLSKSNNGDKKTNIKQ